MGTADELYERLIAPIERNMINSVTRIVRDPDTSADVFQETLAVVWRKLARIDRHPNPHAYIMRICISRAYDALRRKARRRREMSLSDLKADVTESRQGNSFALADAIDAVRTMVGRLPCKQGKAVLMRIVHDWPHKRIGEVLGCSAETARSHVSKGKARLRQLLSGLLT